MAVFRIGELIDGLVADLQNAAFQAQSTGDLLWRPTGLQSIDDDVTEIAMPDQFAQSSAAGFAFGLGVYSVVAREMLQLGIDEPVALQLAVDRGAVAAEAGCDLQDRHPGVMPAGDLVAVIQVFSPGIWWIGFRMNRSGSDVQILQMYS